MVCFEIIGAIGEWKALALAIFTSALGHFDHVCANLWVSFDEKSASFRTIGSGVSWRWVE
jgi:hypothetical protein